MQLVITYFDSIFGPKLFMACPDDITSTMANHILKFMNLEVEESFLEASFVEEQIKIINYLFDLESEWARGKKEMVMISVIVDKNYKTEIFQDILMNIVDNIKRIENSFKGFYKNHEKFGEDPTIDDIFLKIKHIISNGLNDVKNALENPNLGIFLVLGLSKVGKTSILENLRTNLFKKDVKPTLALNVLELILDNNLFKTVDVSGQKKLRNQWWSYTKKPDAIIFVLDVNDPPERFEETKIEFIKLMERFTEKEKFQILEKTPVLICGNKVDLADDLDAKKRNIVELLRPEDYNINFNIQLTSAATGEGLKEGFKWIFQELLRIA